jgi:hypothetical protein
MGFGIFGILFYYFSFTELTALCKGAVVFTLVPIGVVIVVTIRITGATQLRCAFVKVTQLGMGIGSAPEGANPEISTRVAMGLRA